MNALSSRRPAHRLTTSSRVRMYHTLRTAHLERSHELSPATILYRVKRYDFASEEAVGLDLAQVTPLAGALMIARSNVEVLEINEPLMLPTLPATLLALVALRLRQLLGHPRTTVVTYAIGNADPFARATAPKLRTRLRRRVERVSARLVWRRVDRVAFGTSAAEETYETVLGTVHIRANNMMIPALPAPRPEVGLGSRTDDRVVFVGALVERKGIRVLLEAWPLVVARRPGATLLVLGKGALEPEVLLAARKLAGVEVEIDPSRARIHAALNDAHVLALPSQPTPTWREQIGLPIVEGLSHGLSIVTTEQTGLAQWLAEHHHHVLRDPRSASELATAIIHALDDRRDPRDVIAALPDRDGRLAADDWLFSSEPTITDLARIYAR